MTQKKTKLSGWLLLLGISLLIIVHEFGHYLFCKLFGVGVPVFSIGFGPRLLGIKLGETLFQIALFPLGGYVSMQPEDLHKLTYLKKMIIIYAGIGFNILFAFLLLFYLFFKQKSHPTTTINKIEEGSIADQAQLKAGDTIIGLNSHPIESYENLISLIASNRDLDTVLLIQRDNQTVEIPITFSQSIHDKAQLFGIHLKHLPYTPSTLHAIRKSLEALKIFLTSTARFFINSLKPSNNQKNIENIDTYLLNPRNLYNKNALLILLLAFANVQLAFFNILPLPILDGGEGVLYTIEYLQGKPLNQSIINLIHFISLIILIAYFVASTFRRSPAKKTIHNR